LKISKSNISGSIIANPSKSFEQRILAACLLSRQECNIFDFGNSDDVIAARNVLKELGADCIIVNGVLKVLPQETSKSELLFCGESALCARLFTPLACIFKNNFTISGKKTLIQRPIAEDFQIFKQMGCEYQSNDSKLPVVFSKAILKSGQYFIDGSKSSQLISGLMMALASIDGDSKLFVKNPSSINYIYLSIEVLKLFGIKIKTYFDTESEMTIEINGNQQYSSGDFKIEGDWSGACFMLVASAIGGNISVRGLNPESVQADRVLLKVFDLANVNYQINEKCVSVEKSQICGFEFDSKDSPDLIPALAVLAAFATGKSKIYGASRLKTKESSRGEVLVEEMQKLGVKIKLDGDILEIIGETKFNYAEVDSHNDHRIAMALAIIGLTSEKGLLLNNPDCVSKSYPQFFEDLKKIGACI
jgi:3-phosphoshikimate 1-carboxyvinyltransferase